MMLDIFSSFSDFFGYAERICIVKLLKVLQLHI